MSSITVKLAGELPTGTSRDFLTKVAAAISDESKRGGQINLKLVDDKEIASLNKKYAGIAEPTDVLSFPYEGTGDLGDIAISLETAKRQAMAAQVELIDELATLLAHGILHILGHDHQDQASQRKMEALQAKVVTKSGYTYRKMEWKHD